MAYATIDDVRLEGLPDESAGGPNDTLVARWLIEAEQIVDRITRNRFESVSATLILDGSNSHLLHLPVPVISVTSLKINSESKALDPKLYRVFNGRGFPQDDRRNPKIELRDQRKLGSTVNIFPFSSYRDFLKGYDQEIEGTFGWVEPDGSTPPLIRRIVVAIVMTMANQLYPRFEGARGFTVGPLVKEKTDDHELQFASRVADVGNYTLPAEIEKKLLWFKRPANVRVPSVRSFDVGWHKVLLGDAETNYRDNP